MLKYWISDPKIQSLYSEPVYSTKQEVKENYWINILVLMKKMITTDGPLY